MLTHDSKCHQLSHKLNRFDQYLLCLIILSNKRAHAWRLVLGRTQFMSSKFAMFGGFWWVCSSILVDEPGLRMVHSSVFSDLGLGSAHFWPNRFKVWSFCRSLKGFKDWFWWMNLVNSKFDFSNSKQFADCYIWDRSNTNGDMFYPE